MIALIIKFFAWLKSLFLGDECKGGSLHIVYKTPAFTIGGHMTITINSGKTITLGLTLDPDAAGNPTTTLPGPVTWTVSDPTKATLVPSADGLTVAVTGASAGDFSVVATSGNLSDTAQLTTVSDVTTGIHIVQVADAPAPAADAPTAQPA